MNLPFRGLMAPVFTAFTDASCSQINVDIIPEYARRLSESGIKGVLVNGTTGEGPWLTVSEREKLAEKWVEAAKNTNISVMIQVGGSPLPDVLRMARHAEKIGADSLLTLPELFARPKSVNELITYLQLISEAAPNTPLLYYHIPGYTGVTISLKELLEKASVVKTFVGAKFTHTDLEDGSRALAVNNGKYRVFLGCDEILLGAFAMGFDSAIGTTFNIFPKMGLQIQQAVSEGRLEDARHAQKQLSEAVQVIIQNAPWVPGMKAATEMVTGLDLGPARYQKLDEQTKKTLFQNLNKLGLI